MKHLNIPGFLPVMCFANIACIGYHTSNGQKMPYNNAINPVVLKRCVASLSFFTPVMATVSYRNPNNR